MDQIKPTERSLLTVRQFAAKHPAFTEACLRSLIFNASPRYSSRGSAVIPGNGLDVALVRIGRRIYIDEYRFFSWADQQNKAKRAPRLAPLHTLRRR